jgi:hypothetical protein
MAFKINGVIISETSKINGVLWVTGKKFNGIQRIETGNSNWLGRGYTLGYC